MPKSFLNLHLYGTKLASSGYKLTIVVLARVSLHTYMLHNLFVEWE